jgi:hypothetical protein
VHDRHRQAADQHELAAHAHRTAAEHNEKGKNELGNWHLQRALEYSDQAYKLAKEAHPNSGQIGPFGPFLPIVTMNFSTRTIIGLPNYTTVPRKPIALCKKTKKAVR